MSVKKPQFDKNKKLEGFDWFYDLCSSSPKKKRLCLKCRKEFVSTGFGNRTCGLCTTKNRKIGVLARKAPPIQ